MHFSPRLKCLSLLHNRLNSTHQLKQFHAQLIINGLKSPSLFAKLIDQCCAISSPQSTNHAHLIFQHYDFPNLFLLNTLIRCAPPTQSIFIFSNWVSNGNLLLDDFTYIFVLGACARSPSISMLLLGKQVHTQMLKFGVMSYIQVQTTAIHFYASNKDVELARKVFDEMSLRSTASWNAMITGYCSQEFASDALLLFHDMLTDTSGVKPNDTTMVCILSAASQLGVLETGASVHGYIEKTIYCVSEYDVFTGTGLVDMYSKCGSLESALLAFKKTKPKNVLTWTAMMTGLAIHGKGKEALNLLDTMVAYNVKPNEVTFTSLFSACCHAGLVEEGLNLFHNMESKFTVIPQMQHYGCIVDLLGRAGHLIEAFEFIKAMPVNPDAILWRSLLTACKVHGDVVMGEKVGKILLGLKEQSFDGLDVNSEDYVALSNIYASAQRWEDVEMVREEMKAKGIENKTGYSSIQTSKFKLVEVGP